MIKTIKSIQHFVKNYWISILSVVIFFCLWQLGSLTRFLPVDYIGLPTKIFTEFILLFNMQTVTLYLLPSLEALLIGLFLAISLGINLGFAISLNPFIKKAFSPFVYAVNALPMIVFFPLLIIGFGISLWSVVLTIVLMCFVPIMINVIKGVENTSPQILIMAKSFGASKWFMFREITFYSTLPYIFAGIKAAIGRSLIALIVAEIYGLNQGIGYLVAHYGTTYQSNKLFAIVLLILITNSILILLNWALESTFYKHIYGKGKTA